MIKLLNANLYRLKKNKSFWIILILMYIIGTWLYINYNSTDPETCVNCSNALGDVFFGYSPFINILLPIFICLFIGTEYSDGVLKNKIIIGHKRTNIYLSNLITSIIVSTIYTLVYIISVLIIGSILSNDITIQINKFIYLLFDSLFLNILTSSLFTFISISIANKASSLSISLSIVVWSIIITTNILGKIHQAIGIELKIYNFILNIIPYAQGVQILNLTENYQPLWIYSSILSLFINLCGIIIINKKELN